MDIKRWTIDDTLQCQQLTAEYLNKTQDILGDAFCRNENVCQVLGVSNDNDAIEELKDLTLAAAKDGVSVVAIDTSKNKVVGFAFNKLQVLGDPVFEKIVTSWKNPRARSIPQFMADFDNICNLFNHCKVDCIFEVMFVGTLPQYRGRGIANKLFEASLEIATSLKNNINVKQSIDGSELKLEPVPKIASSILTSIYTQKIGSKFGFQVAAEKRYDEMEWEGTRFSDVIGSHTSIITLGYKIL